MGILVGFAPWAIYWVLVGNVPFAMTVSVALAVAIAAFVIGLTGRAPERTLETGAVATFLVLAVLTFAMSQSVMERWALPLSNTGILLVALTSRLVGKPLGGLTARLTWIWVAVFAAMTVSSSVPPIIRGDATILDTKQPLSVVCYWVIPFTLLALGALASRLLSDRMSTAVEIVARKTTFVAYDEATIDELYYLATQHANREVGAGKEAYDVRVGGMATPLVGDESRKSWPATYKVRERA